MLHASSGSQQPLRIYYIQHWRLVVVVVVYSRVLILYMLQYNYVNLHLKICVICIHTHTQMQFQGITSGSKFRWSAVLTEMELQT